MSRLCLLILFLGIIVRFGDCEKYIYENNVENDCTPSEPGSDGTRLDWWEKIGSFNPWKNKNNKNSEGTTISNVHDKKASSDKTRLDWWKKIESFNPWENKNNKNSEGTTISNVHDKKASDKKADIQLFKAIFPGTKWCGDGDTAKNDNDLGRLNGTDACCREHDKCQSDIIAGHTLDNLINNGAYTRSACICDHAFYYCLKNTSDKISSNIIGDTYFNTLKPQCFNCICPTDNCNPETDLSSCKGNCTKYQWFDNPKF